jgi:hypothetical protein
MTNLISTFRTNVAANPRLAKLAVGAYAVVTLAAGLIAYSFGASLTKALVVTAVTFLVALCGDVATYLYIRSNPVLFSRFQRFADNLANIQSDWDTDTDEDSDEDESDSDEYSDEYNCGDPDCDECNQDRSL